MRLLTVYLKVGILQLGDQLDFAQHALGKLGHRHAGTGGQGHEILGVNSVERGEVVHVLQKAGGLYDFREGAACRFKYGAQVFHHLLGLLLDAVNNAKTVYFTERWAWDEIVRRNARKDVSWDGSAKKYLALYDELIKG